MVKPRQNPWQKRVRRLLWFFGAASTIYLLSSYALDRLREARVRALKDKKQKDLIKSHFNSLLSTISFTLYALLPTLQPQLAEAYPVESTSQALQGLSASSSNIRGSVAHTSVEATPEHSVILQPPTDGPPVVDDTPAVRVPAAGAAGVSESWASEFRQRPPSAGEDHGVLGASESNMTSSYGQITDTSVSPAPSTAISLPPTDVSSVAPSSPSDSSSPPFQQSPTRQSHLAVREHNLQVPSSDVAGKSKKELWKDLKMQTLIRTMTTIYLLPLLHILTTSQLGVLSRLRYMHDVKASLPPVGGSTPLDASSGGKKGGFFTSLSIPSLGLSEFIDQNTPSILPPLPNPISVLPSVISTRLPSLPFFSSSTARTASPTPPAPPFVQDQAARAEDERTYLSYSWWILHQGWQDVAERVKAETERVFGGVGLKRDMSLGDWEELIREVRAGVETDQAAGIEGAIDGNRTLRGWTSTILPPPTIPSSLIGCPLPSSTIDRPHLRSLLNETQDHLHSPDFHHLLDKGVSTLVDRLLGQLRMELYSPTLSDSEDEFPPTVQPGSSAERRRRLVDCLPVIDRWGKGIWEGVPDSGVESLLALKEFESFAALVFGDWADTPQGI